MSEPALVFCAVFGFWVAFLSFERAGKAKNGIGLFWWAIICALGTVLATIGALGLLFSLNS
jgi:hypothetical protein